MSSNTFNVSCPECLRELWMHTDIQAEATHYSCPFCWNSIDKEPPTSGVVYDIRKKYPEDETFFSIQPNLFLTELEASLKHTFGSDHRYLYKKLDKNLNEYELPKSKSERRRLRYKTTKMTCKKHMMKEAGYKSIVWLTWFASPFVREIVFYFAQLLYDKLTKEVDTRGWE